MFLYRRKIARKTFVLILIISTLLSIPLSSLTAERLEKPAVKLMNVVTNGSISNYIIDDNGVPKVYYRRLGQSYYNPVYVSMYGLAYYQQLIQSNELDYFLKYYQLDIPSNKDQINSLRNFLAAANWLQENIKTKKYLDVNYGVWEYGFPWGIYNLKENWVSGMAQGVGIQVLIRAWKITGNEKYIETAKLARNAFFIEVKDGGVTYKDNDKEWWYEEYASSEAKESRVLNGMEHSLIGLYELYVIDDDKTAKSLFDKGVQSLKNHIWKFDAGWWTYYDELGMLANGKYHPVNVNLTRKLFEITGEKIFSEASSKWNKYETVFFVREFVKQKPNLDDLTILALNILLIFVMLLVLLKITLLTKIFKSKFEKGSL